MGRIGQLIRVEAADGNGEYVDDLVIDVGGGMLLSVSKFTPPGYDAEPLAGDYVATVSHPGDHGESAVATADPANQKAAAPGDVRIYSRDANGAPTSAVVWVKADKSIAIENEKLAIEVAADGSLSIAQATGSGSIEMDAAGKVSINGTYLTVEAP